MEDFLDGVERKLRPSAPLKAKVTLNAFRKRLSEGHVARRRKRFEKELEAFLQSEPYLRAATKRYLKEKTIAAVGKAMKLLKRAAAVLAKHQGKHVRIVGHDRKSHTCFTSPN